MTNQSNEPTALCRVHRLGATLGLIGLTLLITILLLVQTSAGQTIVRAGSEAPQIDKKVQAEIIDSLSAAFNRIYVFPEVAKKIEKHMRKQYKDGAYDELTNTLDFAQKLSEEVREISKDKHLWVRYVPDEDLKRYQQDTTLTDEEIKKREEEWLRELEWENFGFFKAERMAGNVGYLKFDSFEDAKFGGATAVAALNFLAYCDALIIDLRNNGGGSPSMIQLITSYFFDESLHLNSFYIREQDSIKQFWTQEQVVGPRMTDVDLYVLTSGYTFSAAEEFTYNLKNLERATIIGETTGGGAHPVSRLVFANLNVVASVSFGRAINPITGTNWEGTGIEPHIQVPQAEALDAAHIEAMKKLAEKETVEDVKVGLLWAIETKEALRKPATVDEKILKSYAGVYGPRTITFENGRLFYQREGRPRFEMIPMADDLFCFEDLDYFRIKVNVDADGNPTELVGMYSGGGTDVSPKGSGK